MPQDIEPHERAQDILDELFGERRARIRNTRMMSWLIKRHEVTAGNGGSCDLLIAGTGEYWITRPGENEPANDRVQGNVKDLPARAPARASVPDVCDDGPML